MLVIGLCGGSGTGKNLVQAMLSKLGIPGLDTDVVYHRLIGTPSPLTKALSHRFGKEILGLDGAVDRRRLRDIVFADGETGKAALSDLNRISHAAVLDECRAWLSERSAEGAIAAVINAPLLLESGFHTECDAIVAVLADETVRVARLTERDGLTEAEARQRINRQASDATLHEHADFILRNNGTEAELWTQVLSLKEYINNLAKEQTNG